MNKFEEGYDKPLVSVSYQEVQQRGCGRREEWEQLQKPNVCFGLVSGEVLESQREMSGACEKHIDASFVEQIICM